jgi:hypothetical protein
LRDVAVHGNWPSPSDTNTAGEKFPAKLTGIY